VLYYTDTNNTEQQMAVAAIFLAPDEELITFSLKPVEEAMELVHAARYNLIGHIDTDKTGEAAAEEMFDLSNNPERQAERNEKWGRYRSLSVGDVVHVDNESFVCCSMGWQKL
jgi:hypothetical protein